MQLVFNGKADDAVRIACTTVLSDVASLPPPDNLSGNHAAQRTAAVTALMGLVK